MKRFMLIASMLVGITTFSQVESVSLDWEYNVLNESPFEERTIDFDQNGTIEVTVSSWVIQADNNIAIEMLINDNNINDSEYGSTKINNCGIVQDCASATSTSISGYIYTSNCNNNYTIGIYRIPVYFELADGFHHGLIYVKYNNNIIKIEGYSYNTIPEEFYDCSYLALTENRLKPLGDYKYYNFLGQEVTDPTGYTLKVYENGKVERLFISN